jgi:zinc resistance-associated protein
MNKKNISTTVLAAALVLALASWSVAGPGYGRGGCGGSGWGANPYSELTPEKQAAVETIYAKYDGQLDELRDAMFAKHATLEAMINGGKADEKKIASLVTEMRTLRDKMHDLRTAMNDELVKETGIAPRGGFGRGFGRGNGPESCPGYGQGGYGQGGYGQGNCGQGPCSGFGGRS